MQYLLFSVYKKAHSWMEYSQSSTYGLFSQSKTDKHYRWQVCVHCCDHLWARVFKSIVSGCSGCSWMDCGVPLLTAHHWSLMSPWLCGHLIILRCIAGCFGVVVWNGLGHFGGGLEGALLGSRLLGLLQSAASCLWFSAACTLWPCGIHQPLQPFLWFSSGCVAAWVRCRGFSP